MDFATELFFDIMFKSKVVSDSETRIPHVLAVVLFHNFVQLDRRTIPKQEFSSYFISVNES